MEIFGRFLVKVYDGSKYEASSEKVAEVTYHNVKSAKVAHISDEEIYAEGFDFDTVDPQWGVFYS